MKTEELLFGRENSEFTEFPVDLYVSKETDLFRKEDFSQ